MSITKIFDSVQSFRTSTPLTFVIQALRGVNCRSRGRVCCPSILRSKTWSCTFCMISTRAWAGGTSTSGLAGSRKTSTRRLQGFRSSTTGCLLPQACMRSVSTPAPVCVLSSHSTTHALLNLRRTVVHCMEADRCREAMQAYTRSLCNFKPGSFVLIHPHTLLAL